MWPLVSIIFMSLYFRHKYRRVLNNIMIKIDIEEIFYHARCTVIGRFFGILDKGGEIFFSILANNAMHCVPR